MGSTMGRFVPVVLVRLCEVGDRPDPGLGEAPRLSPRRAPAGQPRSAGAHYRLGGQPLVPATLTRPGQGSQFSLTTGKGPPMPDPSLTAGQRGAPSLLAALVPLLAPARRVRHRVPDRCHQLQVYGMPLPVAAPDVGLVDAQSCSRSRV